MSSPANVIPMHRHKKRIRTFGELLKEALVSDFFRFVRDSGLRLKAAEKLGMRIKSPAVVIKWPRA